MGNTGTQAVASPFSLPRARELLHLLALRPHRAVWIAVAVNVIFSVFAPVFICLLMRRVARGRVREGSGVTSCAQREFSELTAS